MTMTEDIWFKMLLLEVAVFYEKTIVYATKKIDEYKNNNEVEVKWFPSSPEDVRQDIVSYIKKKDQERKKLEDLAAFEQRKKRNEKWTELKKKLETTPARVYNEKSLEFQLGLYIGEDIIRNYMPCLSIDGCSNNSIEVSEEDTAEYEKISNALDAIQFEVNGRGDTLEWKNYIAYRNMLCKKYLPDYLECWVNRISSVNNIEELKKGIYVALVDSDVCVYDANIIEIRNDDRMSRSIITIYRERKFI